MTNSIHLDLQVTLDVDKDKAQVIEQALKKAVDDALDNYNANAQEGESIQEYSMETVLNPEHMVDQIGNYLSHRIEGGDIALEDIPKTMASYGLNPATDFVEFFERLIPDLKC